MKTPWKYICESCLKERPMIGCSDPACKFHPRHRDKRDARSRKRRRRGRPSIVYERTVLPSKPEADRRSCTSHEGRRCRSQFCSTLLCMYNPGPYCFRCTVLASSAERLEGDRETEFGKRRAGHIGQLIDSQEVALV